VLIGHVTKEGVLAGPKTLEHMVDTVLYLEGERLGTLRLLRCVKNRFGSTGEVGVFEMREDGLREVLNPAGIFLEHRTEGVPGTCVTAILEGNKVLLLEVQALTNSTSFGYPRRTASGFDANRLQLLLAIMEKRMGVKMSALDVYVNVAGGFKLEERAADLPVVLAVLSSVKGKALSSSLVAFGEVGLAGEVRGVAQVEKRLKEIEKLGFSEAVCPALPTGVKKPAKLKIQQVKYINFLTDFLS
jgi:DNA repair protein RadA/Sms